MDMIGKCLTASDHQTEEKNSTRCDLRNPNTVLFVHKHSVRNPFSFNRVFFVDKQLNLKKIEVYIHGQDLTFIMSSLWVSPQKLPNAEDQ